MYIIGAIIGLLCGFYLGYVAHKRKSNLEKPEPEPTPETVKCQECRCLLEKSDAEVVLILNRYTLYNESDKEYYCPSHMKTYSKKDYNWGSGWSFYKETEVTKDGEPIGYTKTQEKRKVGRPRKNESKN